ncbi:substrate-binding domain-containing protein [Paenibacillus kribbensis]|uniref:substrate-binding domain-containing protein n=1 Tax=Paenibacillus kribbensis TaxID=172713 RepID=UPI000ABB3824|nr:substrate-binding domain-containing protein [Paenibacillus kribbensis]
MEALEEYQIDIPTSRRLSVAPTILSSQESLKKQLTEYLNDGRQLPTAWFCECDYIAISAIKTLSEMGIKVPEECSVIGFDNINESLIITPELTTIRVEKERMAELAVALKCN